jgi:hypothetical protein
MKPLTEADKIILKDYHGNPIAIIIVILLGLACLIIAGAYAFYLILNLFIK